MRGREGTPIQTTSPTFKENARRTSTDTGAQKSRARDEPSFRAKRTAAVMGPPEFERRRDIGREIKGHILAHPDFYLEHPAGAVEHAGGMMHRCGTADDARATVLEIRREAGARTVTEGGSMIGEAPGSDGHLERHGITPAETDPGEDIIRLRREHPGHPPHAERRDGVTGGFVPRDVVPVTGPSRSAGFERTLEVGAHGPRRPHAVLVEDDPAALTPEGHA